MDDRHRPHSDAAARRQAVTSSERDIEIDELETTEGAQTLRLRGDLAFPAETRRVRILKDGPRRIIVPADHGWDRWYDRATSGGTTRLALARDVARELARAGGAALRRFVARREWAPTLLIGLFLSVTLLFALRARVGLVTLEFGDETEKYVAAQMLRHGRILYGDIYANHGPLAYMLAWGETFLFGQTEFSRFRLAVVVLAVLAISAVIRLAQGWRMRLVAGMLFTAPLSALWFVHPLHMLIYHALDGYLISLMLALLAVPAMLGRQVPRWAMFASGMAGIWAFFAAYPAAVPAALAVISAGLAVWQRHGRRAAKRILLWVMLGAAAGALPIIGWMALHASFRGYLAYHLYLNQVVYGRMVGFGALNFLHALELDFAPAGRAHAYAILLGGLGLAALATRPSLAVALGLLPTAGAVLMLNFKGSPDFPDAAQMIACLAMFAIGLPVLLERGPPLSSARLLALSAATILGAEWAARTALMSPYTMPRSQAFQRIIGPMPNDPLYAELRRLVPPGGAMLAMPFWPGAYINAERPPASGQYYYIPFQAEYDRAPVLGASIDFCGDIDRNKPRAIVLLGARPGSSGDLLTYKPCFGDILRRDYIGRPEFGLFEDQPILYQRRDG